jgi:DNA-binding MarR family transcriptional regulator
MAISKSKKKAMDEARKQIVDYVAANPGKSESDIAKGLGVSRSTLVYQMEKLYRDGVVIKEFEGGKCVRCYIVGIDALAMSEKEKSVLEAISKEEYGPKAIADITKINANTIQSVLVGMVKKGILIKRSEGHRGYYRKGDSNSVAKAKEVNAKKLDKKNMFKFLLVKWDSSLALPERSDIKRSIWQV